MKLTKRIAILASLTVLAGGLASTSVATATTTAAKACELGMFSVSAAGKLESNAITATKPPTNHADSQPANFTPGATKAMSYWEGSMDIDGSITYRSVAVVGSKLYGETLNPDGSLTSKAIGGGWGEYKAVEKSSWVQGPGSLNWHENIYGLRKDGTLTRWNSSWKKTGTFTGFASVKSMALISQTATYDTFLANLTGGGLYTIHIPLNSASKTTAKQIRSTGWAAYDSLVAERCGSSGVLLTAIDKDAGTANLYAIGHATGPTTVIQPLGKIPGTFKNPVYSLITVEFPGNFNGE